MNERKAGPSPVWDLIVVGAGAAGLTGAVLAARAGARVLLLDGKEKIGAKILISGGTRCNLTNARVLDTDFETESRPVMRSVLRGFTSEEAIRFFQSLGIEVVLEAGGKFFPSTHSGRTVLEAFLKELDRLHIELRTSHKVNRIAMPSSEADSSRAHLSSPDVLGGPACRTGRDPRQNPLQSSSDPPRTMAEFSGMTRLEQKKEEQIPFLVEGEGFSFQSRTVLLTTGGLSFPATGSDGSGYGLARALGHSIIPTTASLTPLLTDDSGWKSLSGVSLPVRLNLFVDKKQTASCAGSFLFTHFGFSGPVVLDISRHWIRAKGKEIKLAAQFLPETNEEKLRQEITDASKQNPGQKLRAFLSKTLPDRFVEIFLKKILVNGDVPLTQLKREDRENLLRSLFHFPLRVTGDQGYAKAEVTAGGIPLSEVDKSTLESKLAPGLFFAGEILDVDGRIGGFNFQWAWSSAAAAARGIEKALKGAE